MNSSLPLSAADPEVYAAIGCETQRQHEHLELIASENFVSEAILEAAGSVLTNKYAEGYPGKRYYGGCEYADRVEELARTRACALFGAEHANVQPHSGSQANDAAYAAILEPGDRVLGMDLAHGGHLTHGHPLNFSGRLYQFAGYGVDRETETLDYDALAQQAREWRPKLIVGGGSAYARIIDFPRLRAIADETGARVMVDMAHFAGLVAGGTHPNPAPHADIVTSTTHKTLRGPRAGMILCRRELAAAIDKSVFPGKQGGPLMHIIAAKAVCFREASEPEFRGYTQRVVANAQALAAGLQRAGFRIVSGGTDTHLFLLDVTAAGLRGKEAETALHAANITVNKNAIPFDAHPPMNPSGIRLGTPAVTTRGMGPAEMQTIAALIARVLREPREAGVIAAVQKQVLELAEAFPLYRQRRALAAACPA